MMTVVSGEIQLWRVQPETAEGLSTLGHAKVYQG